MRIKGTLLEHFLGKLFSSTCSKYNVGLDTKNKKSQCWFSSPMTIRHTRCPRKSGFYERINRPYVNISNYISFTFMWSIPFIIVVETNPISWLHIYENKALNVTLLHTVCAVCSDIWVHPSLIDALNQLSNRLFPVVQKCKTQWCAWWYQSG